jgi:hypothetical protein
MSEANVKKCIMSNLEVETFLDRLKYAIRSGCVTINFIKNRKVDDNRKRRHTNRYTISKLFPDECEVDVLKRELTNLSVNEYIETVHDIKFPNRSDMWVFGKRYSEGDVYIKLRVELLNTCYTDGKNVILVMSFHFSEKAFTECDFPYRNN